MAFMKSEENSVMIHKNYIDNPGAVSDLIEDARVHRDVYINQEIFELENEHLFKRTWIYLCHDSQIPNVGDYYSTTIAGEPLFAVRHTDGTVKVLMNRCAHKGAKLVLDVKGNTGKFIKCPYHAWAYDTDGKLLSIPFKKGMENTGFDCCEASHGLSHVDNVKSYRGFVFIRLSGKGIGFEDYFGPVLNSLDNMADRSPSGELEVAGGCLRYMHECNWKMFIENQNDTVHPMVAHASSAYTAERLWREEIESGGQVPDAIRYVVPFGSSYEFFDKGGVRVFENGHCYGGEAGGIHDKYAAALEASRSGYEELMISAYGKERVKEIFGVIRHNTILYPSVMTKCEIQQIRVVRPISASKTLVESWTFNLKGAPKEELIKTQTFSRLINSPFSFVGHDDLSAYESMQEALHASGNVWVDFHRNFKAEEVGPKEIFTNGTSDIYARNEFRAWKKFILEGMLEKN